MTPCKPWKLITRTAIILLVGVALEANPSAESQAINDIGRRLSKRARARDEEQEAYYTPLSHEGCTHSQMLHNRDWPHNPLRILPVVSAWAVGWLTRVSSNGLFQNSIGLRSHVSCHGRPWPRYRREAYEFFPPDHSRVDQPNHPAISNDDGGSPAPLGRGAPPHSGALLARHLP